MPWLFHFACIGRVKTQSGVRLMTRYCVDLLGKTERSLHQWRPEGLQRPGANAWIGAPPPFGVNPASAPGEKNRQAKKKRSSARTRHPGRSGLLKARGP